MDEARLEALLEETTVDYYNEEEEFWSVFYTLGKPALLPSPGQDYGRDR